MISLSGQVCLNHGGREAVAKCPGCGHVFCRECITEHDDQVLCTGCLRQRVAAPRPRSALGGRLLRVGQGVLGLLLAWGVFYFVARMLLTVPADFHDGTVWKKSVFEDGP
jgi:hypothetical protein